MSERVVNLDGLFTITEHGTNHQEEVLHIFEEFKEVDIFENFNFSENAVNSLREERISPRLPRGLLPMSMIVSTGGATCFLVHMLTVGTLTTAALFSDGKFLLLMAGAVGAEVSVDLYTVFATLDLSLVVSTNL